MDGLVVKKKYFKQSCQRREKESKIIILKKFISKLNFREEANKIMEEEMKELEEIKKEEQKLLQELRTEYGFPN